MINVDCGAGKHLRNSFIGIDKVDYGQKYVLDLEIEKMPFDDDSVDRLYANHFLEHLKDTKHFLNECWRVLKKDGIFEINVPYCFWDGAQNPTHFQCITAFWFATLRDDNTVGFKDWKIIKLNELSNSMGQKYEVRCVMTPNKGEK